MQSKKHSTLETILGTAIGFVVSLVAGYAIYPHLNMRTHSGVLIATTIFTVLSLVRGYGVRRLFNWFHVKGVL